MPQDFWRNSGFHLLERGADGRLAVTDDFLRAYYLRPEIRPVEESCDHECELHQSLMLEPRLAVSTERLKGIADEDARQNYRVLLDFRERLLKAASIEAGYAGIFATGEVTVPPLFIDQLAQIILRNILEDREDTLELRAAELFYREQKVSIQDGAVMLADLEMVGMHASGNAYGSVGRLIIEAQTPVKSVNLDVLERDNAALYWLRDQHHDFVVRINHGTPAAEALCRVIEQWVAHFARVTVKVRTVHAIEEEHWAWHIGLDAESSAILNDLWRGEEMEHGRLQRLLLLFRMDFLDSADMRSEIAGRPVYLGLAMDEANIVRMKPQNLLINLPTARQS